MPLSRARALCCFAGVSICHRHTSPYKKRECGCLYRGLFGAIERLAAGEAGVAKAMIRPAGLGVAQHLVGAAGAAARPQFIVDGAFGMLVQVVGAGGQAQPVGLGMALVPEIAPIEGACGDGQGKPPEEIHVMTPTRGDEGGNNPLSRRGAAPFYRGGSGAGYARMGNKRTCWWSGWQAAGSGLGIIYPLKRWVVS